MAMTKTKVKEIKKQFIGIIKLLGPERLRPSGFRQMFKGEPELIEVVNKMDSVSKYLSTIPHLDERMRDTIIHNMFG